MFRTLRLFPALASTLLLLAAAGCPKECRDETYCTRTCDCRDAQRNRIIECPMSFQCNLEGETGYCEDDYNGLSCDGDDGICKRYAATGLCGSKVCVNEEDCQIEDLLCEIRDQQTGQLIQQYFCDLAFSCDLNAGACEAAYAAPVAQHCQTCLEQGGGVFGASLAP